MATSFVLALALTGCTTVTASRLSASANVVCDVWSPITYDGKLDTEPTKDQIKRNNVKRNAFCKGDQK